MLISLLCPTRNRPKNLEKLLNNIQETITNKNDVEIMFKYDDDDIITKNFLVNLRNKYNKLNIFETCSSRSEYLNRDYYNFLSERAKGNYLWAIGDDVRFKSKNWDIILKEKIENYLENKEDKIAYISVNEKDSQAKHPCFPLITKEAFKFLNMYFHPQLMSWGADRCIWEIYSNPKINRVLHIPEIEIEHLSYHDGKASFDETAKSMKERFFRNPECHNQVSMYIIPQQLKQLEKYIEDTNKNARVV